MAPLGRKSQRVYTERNSIRLPVQLFLAVALSPMALASIVWFSGRPIYRIAEWMSLNNRFLSYEKVVFTNLSAPRTLSELYYWEFCEEAVFSTMPESERDDLSLGTLLEPSSDLSNMGAAGALFG
jgi:hypothetical protein